MVCAPASIFVIVGRCKVDENCAMGICAFYRLGAMSFDGLSCSEFGTLGVLSELGAPGNSFGGSDDCHQEVGWR